MTSVELLAMEAEKNYNTMKLEFWALKSAETEKCNEYLYWHEFTVMTDDNPPDICADVIQIENNCL